MKKRYNRPLKVDSDTLAKLKKQQRELQVLESRDRIPLGEIVDRIIKAPDIPDRLKVGAIERRRGMR